MNAKPQYFFYQFPTGDEKYTIEPERDGSYALNARGSELGCFATAAEAALAAAGAFQCEHPDLTEMARKMRDLDWWERSPESTPRG